ncbi:hypothetical protein ACFRLW_17750 [Streptomyces sp. NPDC056728]
MTDQDQGLGHVTIGAREIYDEVRATREAVNGSTQALQAVAETLADHETRIRSVERWKYSNPTALAIAVISAGVTIATKLGT